MCGSFGKGMEGQLLACAQCAQCYHPYCVNSKVSRWTVSSISQEHFVNPDRFFCKLVSSADHQDNAA